jgi:hypothetical protein
MNREYHKEYYKEWYKNHREERLKYLKKWQKDNKNHIKLYNQIRYRNKLLKGNNLKIYTKLTREKSEIVLDELSKCNITITNDPIKLNIGFSNPILYNQIFKNNDYKYAYISWDSNYPKVIVYNTTNTNFVELNYIKKYILWTIKKEIK